MVETVISSFEERERKLVEMKLYGYTQAEIANELGLSQSYVSALCTGQSGKQANSEV